jgi:hypothetical protein
MLLQAIASLDPTLSAARCSRWPHDAEPHRLSRLDSDAVEQQRATRRDRIPDLIALPDGAAA